MVRNALTGVGRYYWAGTKLYDLLAGAENIESSYFLTKSKALDAFPMLKKDNLFGALVYYGWIPQCRYTLHQYM